MLENEYTMDRKSKAISDLRKSLFCWNGTGIIPFDCYGGWTDSFGFRLSAIPVSCLGIHLGTWI